MAEPMLLKSTDTQTVVQVGKQVYLPSALHEAIVSFLVILQRFNKQAP
jgi:hypothetical protein